MANSYVIGPAVCTGYDSGAGYSPFSGKVLLSETVNTASNSSTIAWSFVIYINNSQYISNYSYSNNNKVTVVINGQTLVSTNNIGPVAMNNHYENSGAGPLQLCSGTVDVPHNSDGSKALVVSANYTQSNSAYMQTIAPSGTVNLQSIIRSDKLSTVPSLTLAGSGTTDHTVSWTNSGSFYHSIEYKYGSTTLATANVSGTSATSYTYAVPASWASNVTNAKTMKLTVVLHSYSNSGRTNELGSDSKTFTVTFADSFAPSVSGVTLTIYDSVGNIITCISGKTYYGITHSVSFKADAGFKSATAVYVDNNGNELGARVSGAVSQQGDSVSYTLPKIPLFTDTMRTIGVKCTVTDTRGISTSYTGAVSYYNVYGWSAPTITSLTAYRCDSNGDENERGSYMKVMLSYSARSLNNQNRANWVIRYRWGNSSTYYDFYSGTNVSHTASFTVGPRVLTSPQDDKLEVRLEVSDILSDSDPTYSSVLIHAPYVFVDMLTKVGDDSVHEGIAIGKVNDKRYWVQSAWPLELTDTGKVVLDPDVGLTFYDSNDNEIGSYPAFGGVGGGYATVSDMVADTSLSAGTMVQTRGYYSAGDGGGTTYKISATSEYIGSVSLTNGLYANIVERGRINALTVGFKRDGNLTTHTDNKSVMDDVLTVKNSQAYQKEQLTLYFPNGMYAFSATKIQAWGLTLEGEGNPFATNTRFLGTVFCPMGNQDYIIMMGTDDTNQFLNAQQHNGNGIKNIQFTCNKPNTDSRYGTQNNYQVNAALVINRQFMGKFSDLAFYFCYGTGLKIASSWECLFSTLMFRNILATSKGAFNVATDFMSAAGTTSDCSSNYFENIELESIAGPFINFEKDCNFENNVINSIIVEDYRLDMPGRSASDSWGTEWTDDTWLPAGVSSPDIELGIFHFEEGAYYSNNIINAITASMYAVRSYYYPTSGSSRKLYTHDAIVKCAGFPRRLDFHCTALNVQYNRTDVRTLIYNFPWTPADFNFTIDSAVLNDSTYNFILEGVCKNYVVNDVRLRNAPDFYSGYISAYKCSVIRGFNASITNSAISGETVTGYAPIGKYSSGAYAEGHIAQLLPNKQIYTSPATIYGHMRLPVLGKTLNIRIYQGQTNRILWYIYDKNGDRVGYGNFSSAAAGWAWVYVDTSQYIQDGTYITLLNRDGNVADENLVDVMYWSY